MIYTNEQLRFKLGSYCKIKTAVKRGEYFKVSHGLYSDESPYLNEMESIFARYPEAILTLESAFEYYEMSDYIPDKYIVATSQKAHRIDNNKVEQIYISKHILDIGKTVVKTQYGSINVYNKERLLIELFRLKKKLSFDYYKAIVAYYRTIAKTDELDFYTVVKYCREFKNGDSLLRQIREVIL